MTYIVDLLFPPLKIDEQEDGLDSSTYSSFNYWRDPIFDVDLEISRSNSPVTEGSTPLPTIPEA
jgi:hypothetical protein